MSDRKVMFRGMGISEKASFLVCFCRLLSAVILVELILDSPLWRFASKYISFAIG